MSGAAQYSFTERMRMSDGVSVTRNVQEILCENIPGATRAERANAQDDRHGTDWWVLHESGKRLSIDYKVREQDWAATHPREDDLALETWSVVEGGKVGWTRDEDKRTDYVLWLWKDTGRWCLVPFPMLCAVFSEKWEEWKAQYKTRPQETPEYGGYHSECTFVPRVVVWREIYNHYGGKLN